MTLVTPGTEVLEQAFDEVRDAIMVIDLEGTVTRWNRAAEELYRIAREDAVGQKVRALLDPSMPDEEAGLVMSSVVAGQRWSGEMLVRCGDGRSRLLRVTNLPLFEDGRVAGLMGLARERPLGTYGAREASDALLVVDDGGRIALWSAALRDELGVDLSGRDVRELIALVHPDDLTRIAQLLGDPQSVMDRKIEVRLRNGFDGYSAFAISANDLTSVPGVGGLVLTLHRRRDELSMRALAVVTSTRTQQAVFTVDLRGFVTRWRPGAAGLYGWTAAEITGHPMTRLGVAGNADAVAGHLAQARRGRGVVHYEARHQTKFGRPIDVEVSLSVVVDDEGTPLEILVVVADLSATKHGDGSDAEANVDVLTGLPKEALVLERLRVALTQVQPGQAVAVLFVDVDSFKLVNDSLGHQAGDDLLVAIGERLVSCVSASDVVGRLGSDEFVVVCSKLPGERAATGIAARILDRISEPIVLSGHEVLPAVSIGIALAECPNVDAAQLLNEADTAMYRAKANGRARYVVFDQALHQRALLRLELEEELRRALREHELRVRYQPVVSLEDGAIRGVEALMRWEHPERGLLLPSEFLPMAEETGLVVPIGRQVIADACAQLASWHRAGYPDLTLAINLSPRQLADPQLLEHLLQQISLHGIAAESVVLELTEHALLTEALTDPAALLREFRDAGFRLSIDDFGTGYCSLLYLRHFPVTQLKLDRFFISGLGRDPLDEAIIENVLRMAQALGLEAVAEGIERPEQLARLRHLGCGFGQGFLWAPALDGDELLEMLPGRLVPAPTAVVPDRADHGAPSTPGLRVPTDRAGRVVSLVLIDDSAAERMLLRARLEETGRFDVVGEAADGRHGIELVRTLRPDHVVFDLSIAGMDGLDVVSQLRDLAPRALITIVSGHVSPSLRRAVLNRGATACLDKNASLRWLVDELLFHAFHEPSSELGPPVSSRAIQRCGRSRDGELRRDPARGG